MLLVQKNYMNYTKQEMELLLVRMICLLGIGMKLSKKIINGLSAIKVVHLGDGMEIKTM